MQRSVVMITTQARNRSRFKRMSTLQGKMRQKSKGGQFYSRFGGNQVMKQADSLFFPIFFVSGGDEPVFDSFSGGIRWTEKTLSGTARPSWTG